MFCNMKINKYIFIMFVMFSNIIISCKEESINEQFEELDILKHKYEYNPSTITYYERVLKQIKLDAIPSLLDLNITPKFSGIYPLEDSLHNQVFRQVNRDSNIIECEIWMVIKGRGELLIAHQNKTYPMDYIRKLIHDKDYDNPTYRSQIAIIPILRIFEEGFQLNNLNTYITKEQEKKYMIEKYYNVIYIEKEWIQNDYFMRIKLFVKQNDRDNLKSNI
jgi:hypothetical protein